MHDQVPLSGVPDVGLDAEQLTFFVKLGEVNEHVAEAAPERSSVTFIVHVTVCDVEVVLTEDGVKLNPVRFGGVVSHCANAGTAHAAAKTAAKAIERATRRWFMTAPPP